MSVQGQVVFGRWVDNYSRYQHQRAPFNCKLHVISKHHHLTFSENVTRLDRSVQQQFRLYSSSVPGPTSLDIHKHSSNLAKVLGIPENRFMHMVKLQPSIFSFTPEALDVSISAIASLTGLQRCQVPQILMAQPRILLQPDILKANLSSLCRVLNMPLREVLDMASREPQVLALDGPTVDRTMYGLLKAFSGSRPIEVVKAVLSTPSLLLEEPGSVETRITSLASQLQVDRFLLAVLMTNKPSLLSIPADILKDRLVHLANKSGFTTLDVVQHIQKGPDLLAVSSCLIDKRCKEVSSIIACTAESVAAMLLLHPKLLHVSSGELYTKWQLLQTLTSSCASWRTQLAEAPPDDKAALVLSPYNTLARLRYLVDMGKQAECGLVQTVRSSDVHFHLQYPDFRSWLRA